MILPLPRLVSLVLLVQFLTANLVYAEFLHVILVADTASENGSSALYEMDHVKRELEQVAAQTGMKLKQQLFYGSDDCGQVLAAVRSLKPAPDDSVVFYFIGHGYRTSTKTGPWPFLFFSREPADLNLQEVLEHIIIQHPRFGLIVADCCNNVMDDVYPLQVCPLWKRKESMVKGYRRLFLDSHGILVICAAKPGDYAYCDARGYGHLFSQAFWRAIQLETRKNDPSWLATLGVTSSFLDWIQFPYYEFLEYR